MLLIVPNRYQVTDTGIGMNQAQIASAFDAFSQGDSSTTRRYGGTGLGLAITKSFCELLGGSVVVDSHPGVGSTFTARLPASLVSSESSVEATEQKG